MKYKGTEADLKISYSAFLLYLYNRLTLLTQGLRRKVIGSEREYGQNHVQKIQ